MRAEIVVALIATRPREAMLTTRSVPSIARQTRLPDLLVVVSDSGTLTNTTTAALQASLPHTPMITAKNRYTPGVAGVWNTGIGIVQERYTECHIAILDDDDEWDSDHIGLCVEAARHNGGADVVLSGLRARIYGSDQPRQLPSAWTPEDFLAGNPGWQGSNTFIRLETLIQAGGFTEGLASCNDRDLAIRVLSLAGLSVAFTGKFTATWHLGTDPDQLSAAGGNAKRIGLAHFLKIHQDRMSQEIRQAFFSRASELFGFTEKEILDALKSQ